MSQTPSPVAYRPCVGIVLINRDGLIWTGCRTGVGAAGEGPGSWWQMPQGGIDENEDPRQAALRELFEETGISRAEIIAETPDWLRYDLPPNLVPKSWGGRYRGQKQKWFAMRFTGKDSEVNLTPAEGHQIEFVAWRWARPADVLANIVSFKRPIYELVLGTFKPLIAA